MESEEGSNNRLSTTTSSSSRWNPTKEQISMLENLYKQGIKTPSAEEIQQITSRLKVYGHIEGKNVFYWFQNHKARQRQKQKQDTLAYYNRFLNTPHNIFSTPPSNVSALYTTPYCVSQSQSHEMLTYYPQNPKVLLPAKPVAFRRNQAENMKQRMNDDYYYCSNQETLDLFPLHPTGILEGKRTGHDSSGVSAGSSTDDAHSGSSHHYNNVNQENGCHENVPFFDFFSSPAGQGS